MLDARIMSDTMHSAMLENPNEKGFAGCFKHIPFVYAHGKLEEDFGTDIISLFKGDLNLRNGLIAYTYPENKPCKFFLYKNPRTFELTGIVCYTDDKDACEYGKKLIEEQPKKF